MADSTRDRPTEPTLGELVQQVTQQASQLARQEVQLAQAEMQQKAKKIGVGAGLFGAAGVIALYGVGALVATVILLLALAMDAWLAALIVTVVLFVAAGVAALVGKREVGSGTPLKPEATIENVKQDVATVKEARR